jgi:hypothetical protein
MRVRSLLDGVLAHERTRSDRRGKTSQIVAHRAATSDQAVMPAANVPLSGEKLLAGMTDAFYRPQVAARATVAISMRTLVVQPSQRASR